MSEISWDCGRAPSDVALISIWMCGTTGFTCCASFAFFYLLLFAFCTRNRLFSPEQLKRKTESLWMTQQVQLCCGAGEDRWSIVWCCKPLWHTHYWQDRDGWSPLGAIPLEGYIMRYHVQQETDLSHFVARCRQEAFDGREACTALPLDCPICR